MKVTHSAPDHDEHRVTVYMTTLEAEMWMRGDRFVRITVLQKIKAALAGCDQR